MPGSGHPATLGVPGEDARNGHHYSLPPQGMAERARPGAGGLACTSGLQPSHWLDDQIPPADGGCPFYPRISSPLGKRGGFGSILLTRIVQE